MASLALPSEAFDNLLGLFEEAVDVAEQAVKHAKQKPPQPPAQPPVILTKVAADRCHKVAQSLQRTGLFNDDISRHLQSGDPEIYLNLLEKLASSAMFPMEVDIDLRGDLVEKPASNKSYSNLPSKTAVWQKARDEAEAELNQ